MSKKTPCWKGYKRKPGTKLYSKGSCVKEVTERIVRNIIIELNNKYQRPTEKGAGLTKAGVEKYRRENPGSKLQTAVTEKNPSGKRAARRKSFCARMQGVVKKAKGPAERAKASLRRWNC